MCRGTEAVAPPALGALGRLLTEMRDVLAAEAGVDPADCTIGPVDFGPCDDETEAGR